MTIKGGHYLTVEQYRIKYGFAHKNSVLNRLRDGRLEGAIKINRQWLIPASAIPTDNRITTGEYALWRKRYGKNKITQSDET